MLPHKFHEVKNEFLWHRRERFVYVGTKGISENMMSYAKYKGLMLDILRNVMTCYQVSL